MSVAGSTLDEEPFVVDTPAREKDDSDVSSDDDDEEQVSVRRKFEEILRDLKNNQCDLRDAANLNSFILHNGSYLGQKTTGDGDHNTLMHLLVEDAKDKVFDKYQPLFKLLLDRHPELLAEKDSNEKTPLYIAISKKRDKLVRFMCSNHPKINSVLRIPCYHSENCLHVAIRRNVAPKLAVFLIQQADESTLCDKDDKGNTPLHLAVDYDRCTDAQLEIVTTLISRCDRAMDERTNPPNSFSAYQHHEYTRVDSKKAADADAKKAVRGKMKDGPQSVFGDGSGKIAGAQPPKLGYAAQQGTVSIGHDTPFVGPESGKIGGLRRVNTGSELTWVKGLGSGEPTKIGLRIPGSGGPGSVEGDSLNPKTPVAPKGSSVRKKVKEEVKVTEESANIIRNYLKLHCMRSRNHDDAVDFLYGRNQENQIYFDLYDSPSLIISEERIEEGLAHLKFEDILQYVALPSMQLEEKPVTSKLNKKQHKYDGKGRSDMIFLFDFLRRKNVKRVIRVIVDDRLDPPHSDEAIEKALGGLKVEIWDWRKHDLCTETIITAAPDTREVCLYWSGNNAVLRGWSEPGGLNLLRRLEKVNLHVEQGLETSKRTRNNVKEFLRRLKMLRPEVEVEVVEELQPENHVPTGGPVDTANEQYEHRHKWLTCMDEFADFIQNVDSPQLLEPITIALIDDGVDINEQSLHAKIIGGRSFCQRDKFQNLSKPYYVTSGGHGTVMASLICRVCPKTQLYVVKLDEYTVDGLKRQITAKSAAKAVRAAVDKGVHIISMSWTIERTVQNAADIADLESAVEAAARAGILMFCAANDQGIASDRSYPAACGGTKHLFKIGAAEASGAVWKWVGDPADVDFIFPGHNVVKDRPNDTPLEKCKTLTGSSVATAFAAGLAALVLHCVQLGAFHTQNESGNAVTMDDFRAIKGHERMKEAFLAIGTSPASGNKYVEVWDVFGPAAKKAERLGREERIEIVADVAGRLKTRKTFE